jgi:hypothetical protein
MALEPGDYPRHCLDIGMVVSITDLHETGDRRHTSQIDSVDRMFAAVVAAITAIAGIVAYHGKDAMMIASSPAAHVVASR